MSRVDIVGVPLSHFTAHIKIISTVIVDVFHTELHLHAASHSEIKREKRYSFMYRVCIGIYEDASILLKTGKSYKWEWSWGGGTQSFFARSLNKS